MKNTADIQRAGNDYATHSIGKPLQNLLAGTQDYYAGAPGRNGVQLAAKGVGPIEQLGRKGLDWATRWPAFIGQRVADAADRSNTAGQDLSRGQLMPGNDQFGQYHAGALGNAALTVGHSALAAASPLQIASGHHPAPLEADGSIRIYSNSCNDSEGGSYVGGTTDVAMADTIVALLLLSADRLASLSFTCFDAEYQAVKVQKHVPFCRWRASIYQS